MPAGSVLVHAHLAGGGRVRGCGPGSYNRPVAFGGGAGCSRRSGSGSSRWRGNEEGIELTAMPSGVVTEMGQRPGWLGTTAVTPWRKHW